MRILFLFLTVSFTAVVAENYNKTKIHYTLGSAYKNCRQAKNPGMVAFVVKDGQVEFSEAFGLKNLETNQPMTTSTQFGIGSLTKIFANLLIQKYFGEDSR